MIIDQNRAPLFEAIARHIEDDVTPFHVPGHKRGRGLSELRDYLGERTLLLDLNAMADIDDLSNPVSVICEAQQLAAAAFGADQAHFLINGTTSGIHAMFLSALKPGDDVIVPRNAHKSTFTGLILSGANPVYVYPDINSANGILSAISIDSIKKAYQKVPQANAILAINPTYYGIAPDLQSIVDIAREHNSTVMVDEAHGCHLYFHEGLPINAMQAGADMAAVSTHKTGGSLTQSSILLKKGSRIPDGDLFESLNALRSSSASYLLLVSLDLARKQLAVNGREMLQQVLELADDARSRINRIEGMRAYGQEMLGKEVNGYAFDRTKLVISASEMGITGYLLEKILREEYRIQIELADMNNVLAIISLGDSLRDIDRLVEALQDISNSKKHQSRCVSCLPEPERPQVVLSPRDAFYSRKTTVVLAEAAGRVSGDMILAYPPGIPLICPGELITPDIVSYIEYLRHEGSNLQGTPDPSVKSIRILDFT